MYTHTPYKRTSHPDTDIHNVYVYRHINTIYTHINVNPTTHILKHYLSTPHISDTIHKRNTQIQHIRARTTYTTYVLHIYIYKHTVRHIHNHTSSHTYGHLTRTHTRYITHETHTHTHKSISYTHKPPQKITAQSHLYTLYNINHTYTVRTLHTHTHTTVHV